MKSAEKKLFAHELRPSLVRASSGMAGHGMRPVLWLALILVLPFGLTHAQTESQQSGTGQLSNHPLRYESGNMVPSLSESTRNSVDQEKRLRQLNAAKYKSIASNTDKLLKMVTELNAEISNSNPTSLTPDQLRKIAAIEKLAHSVKDEMRTPVQSPPEILDPTRPLNNTPYQR
jgi:hypothetical protein